MVKTSPADGAPEKSPGALVVPWQDGRFGERRWAAAQRQQCDPGVDDAAVVRPCGLGNRTFAQRLSGVADVVAPVRDDHGHVSHEGENDMLLGLRTVIYPAPDLARSKAWFTDVLGVVPYFDQPFYVGFQVAGYELALDPGADPATGPVTYWGVADADVALAVLLRAGAEAHSDGVSDVGDRIRVATVREPGGSLLGVIENPHFQLPDTAAPDTGPGR